jgi:hypothetical protein
MDQIGQKSSILLVQNESENSMHRVLYFLRLLRAMILHSVLLAIATTLYLSFGVSGLYPAFDQMVEATRTSMQQSVHPALFVIYLVVTQIALFVIIYLSITRVWRKFLKIQSTLFLFGIFTISFICLSYEQFAAQHFTWLFLFLLTLYVAFMYWAGIDIAIGLWKVSLTPEVSSFRATLDPRLTRGVWRLINKLLDLPRTPLRNWRAFAAYLLSLVGAIGAVESLSYLIGAGNVWNKLAILQANCADYNVDECFNQSALWANGIVFWLVVSIFAIKLSLTAQAAAKKLGAISAHEVLKTPREKYVLYLRSFETDDVRLPRPRLPLLSRLMSPWSIPARVEEELFDVADGYLPLIAIGRPGKIQQTIGGLAYREYLSDDGWQTYVKDKIQNAERLVLLLNTTAGVLWELGHVLAQEAGPRTLFLFDPKARDSEAWRSIKDAILPIFVQAGLMLPSFNFQRQVIAFYFAGNQVVEIENSNWSVSSYRTAFSHFLSEQSSAVP